MSGSKGEIEDRFRCPEVICERSEQRRLEGREIVLILNTCYLIPFSVISRPVPTIIDAGIEGQNQQLRQNHKLPLMS